MADPVRKPARELARGDVTRAGRVDEVVHWRTEDGYELVSVRFGAVERCWSATAVVEVRP